MARGLSDMVRDEADRIVLARGGITSTRSVERLERENAKLRDLLAELYQCSRQYGCDRCSYKDGCSMFDRMAQLGIEVDG